MIEGVRRAVSIETETINCNMDSIMEKLTALQRKIDRMDRESSRGIGMRLLTPRLNNRNPIFFGSPTSTGLGQGRCWKITPGKNTAVRRSCVPPPLYRH